MTESNVDLDAIRKAFGDLRHRVDELERRLAHVDTISENVQYAHKMVAKLDRLSAQQDDALPRMTRAEAELGRACEQTNTLWRLIGENANGIVQLRERLKEKT